MFMQYNQCSLFKRLYDFFKKQTWDQLEDHCAEQMKAMEPLWLNPPLKSGPAVLVY